MSTTIYRSTCLIIFIPGVHCRFYWILLLLFYSKIFDSYGFYLSGFLVQSNRVKSLRILYVSVKFLL